MDPDMQSLLAAWLGDHDPGDGRRAALLARLAADPAFRRAFADEVYLLGRLRAVQSAEPRWLRLEDETGWSARPRPDAAALTARVVQAVRRRQRARRVARWSAVGVAAAVLVAAGLFAPAHRPEPPPAEAVVPRVQLATVVHADEVEWAGDPPPVGDGDILTAGRLRLAGGRLTLAYFNGVVLTVAGPADIDLTAADRVVCHRGRLRVTVPRGAEGFTVAGDRFEVVDLGTEFAVNREAAGGTQVKVFRGDVAVTVFGGDGRPLRGVVLHAGQAVELDAAGGRLRSAAPPPEAFVPFGRFEPEELSLADGYRAAVLAARPWGYWRFEAVADGRVPNEVPGRPGLLPVGGVSLAPSGAGNGTARFRPDDPWQAFQTDDPFPLPQAGDYALELWAQADLSPANAFGRHALVGLLDRRVKAFEGHVGYLELMGRGRPSPHAPCAVRFVDRWPAAVIGGADLFSRPTVVPTRWRHYVCQKAGDVLELYVDGALVGTSPVARGDAPAVTECLLVVGRLKRLSQPPDEYEIRPFHGRLDEVAVYDHPLPAAEVRRHAGLRVTDR